MLISFTSFSEGTQPIVGKVISTVEKSNSGKLKIEIEYTVFDTIYLKSVPGPKSTLHNGRTILLPDGAPDWKQKQYLPGETFIILYKYSFDKQDLPVFPIELEFSLEYNFVRIPKGPKKDINEPEILTCITLGNAYFHHDGIVEISNPLDFNRLDRVWFTTSSNLTFGNVNPADIPVSDVYPLDTLKEEWQDDYNLHFVEGLPYMVATKPVHPDTIAKYNNDDLPYGVEPDSLFEDSNPGGRQSKAMKIRLYRKYKGTITGRLMTTYTNDQQVIVQLPLAGVLVKLKEKDKIYSEEFDETHTDDQGFFTLSYDRNQSFAEGKDIELFLKFKSKNKVYDIKVKEHAILGGAYEHVHWLGHNIGQNYTNAMGTVLLNNNNFRPVHWAFRCWKHALANGVPMFHNLSILTNRNGSKFLPIIPGVTPIELKPTIRLTESATRNENTIYHEFGHFLMWQAQGRNYIIVPGVDGSTHTWSRENTSRLAWSEGWADAHEFIMDAVLRNDDSEYGEDDGYLGQHIMELRRDRWQSTSGGSINNGIDSEYFIACAIYDLWDGADKGLPVLHPGTTTIHGFNDFITFGGAASNWVANEDISYSFRQIVRPLINHSGLTGKIQNIDEYFHYFLNETAGSACEERERVSRVFNENRVVFDIRRFERERGYGSMSSDDIKVKVFRRIGGLFGPVPMLYEEDLFLSNFQDAGTTVNTLDYKFHSSSNKTISDFDVFGFTNAAGTILATTNLEINTESESSNDKNGTLQMCARSGVIMQSGELRVGGPSNDYKGTIEIGNEAIILIDGEGSLEVNPGSAIVVKAGGSLMITNGADILIRGNGKIVIESGGFLCVEAGTNINLQDLQSLIELHAGANTGVNPALDFIGNCIAPCSIPYIGQGAIVNVSDQSLTIAGPDKLNPLQEQKYSVTALTGFTFTWVIEGDAQIISGQGTNEVTIRAGSEAFTLFVTGINATTCEARSGNLIINVKLPVNALQFDGANDFVEIADRNSLNFSRGNFTFETKFQSNFIGTASFTQIILFHLMAKLVKSDCGTFL